jgi:hypothetical protein
LRPLLTGYNPQLVSLSLQLGTIPSTPGGLLAEDSLAPGRLQRGGLCRRVLFVGRNARVAYEHGCGKVLPLTLSMQYLFATQRAGIWCNLGGVAPNIRFVQRSLSSLSLKGWSLRAELASMTCPRICREGAAEHRSLALGLLLGCFILNDVPMLH